MITFKNYPKSYIEWCQRNNKPPIPHGLLFSIIRTGKLQDRDKDGNYFFNWDLINSAILKPNLITIKKFLKPKIRSKIVSCRPEKEGFKYSKEDKLIYSTRRQWFIKRNQIDLVFLFVFGKFTRATHVHHSKGRKENLNNIDYFIATTKQGDDWIHKNPEKAKELGFLA